MQAYILLVHPSRVSSPRTPENPELPQEAKRCSKQLKPDPEFSQPMGEARFPPLTGVGAEALQGNLFSLMVLLAGL